MKKVRVIHDKYNLLRKKCIKNDKHVLKKRKVMKKNIAKTLRQKKREKKRERKIVGDER